VRTALPIVLVLWTLWAIFNSSGIVRLPLGIVREMIEWSVLIAIFAVYLVYLAYGQANAAKRTGSTAGP
jgi:hypothetical protein